MVIAMNTRKVVKLLSSKPALIEKPLQSLREDTTVTTFSLGFFEVGMRRTPNHNVFSVMKCWPTRQ